MASKGKAIAVKDSTGKRKRKDNDNGGSNKRKNRDVLQFFEDSAAEFDGDDSDDSDDFFNIDVKSEPGKFEEFPFFPKEEELSGDELEKMLAERYRTKSGYVRYAEDDYDSKRSVDKSFLIPSVVEPTIWKVKCKVGREKNTVFCLIQKFVDLKELGNKLQIISAFAVEHIKGFVFVEAEKQSDVAEACNQLADVYFSLVTKVPTNEVGQLLVVRKRYNEVKEGTWARVKNGIYRGDLTQVVAVNNERKRATVKLIPRIDLQALTVKYGGGAILKRTKGSVPAARLISSRDLEEFRPLIQYRRDRDTGKMFEFLDSLMLKDGFLYKKVSFDSLSFWGVNPSEDELQKFIVPCNDESDNVEWLSQLYGEQKKCNEKINKGGGKGEGLSDKGGGKGEGLSNKGGGKGEGSSGSHEQSSFEVHDLVLFGKRDFGMVIGMEKDDSYKILKDGSDGPVIMALGQKDLKYVPQDKKFTALDHRMKTISINDTVRILDGPSKERQGIVKQIYRGIIFLYDENDLDNAYFCTKSQMCEKVKHDGGPSGFEDVPSSPKSPLSPKKTWQMRENNSEGIGVSCLLEVKILFSSNWVPFVDLTGKDELFSIGQSLRIRIGPLKGYLCRVLAIRYSDVTVKLDSKQKVLTVKRDHLVEVRGKSSASLIGGDPELSSPFKPFDLLGSEGTTNDWLQASGSADGDGWNVGGLSSERTAWPAFPSSGASLQASTSATDLHSSVDDWLSKVAVGNEKAVDDTVGGWGSAGGWGKEKATGSWDTGKCTEEQGGWNDIGSSGASGWCKQKGGGDGWAEPKCFVGPSENSWGKAADGWGNKNNVSESSGWGSSIAAASQSQAKDSENKGSDDPWGKVADKWGNKDSSNRGNEWGNSANKPAGDGWGNKNNVSESSGWGSSIAAASQSQAKDSENKGSDDPWGKHGSSWGNSSVENVGLTSTWGEGKSWNDNKGDDNKGVDNSNELNKDVGAWSSQNSTPQTGWDGASFGTSRWGQKSLDSGGNDRQDQDNSEDDPWGKLSKKTRNNAGAFQGSWGGGEGKSVGWKKDSIISSSGWAKGGDVSSEGRESWSKPEENNSWGMKNSDNVHGSSWGGGSGGRRGGRGGFRGGRDQSGRGGFRGGRDQSGRGGFRGGRDQFGRGGGGRSGSQGQFSSWKNEGQSANNEGSSWSGDGGGGQDSGWKKPAEGASAWGAGSKGGWSSSRYMEATSWKKPTEGCSSWGGEVGLMTNQVEEVMTVLVEEGGVVAGVGEKTKVGKGPVKVALLGEVELIAKEGGVLGAQKTKTGKGPVKVLYFGRVEYWWSWGGEDKGGWKKPSEGGSSSGGWITGGAGVGKTKEDGRNQVKVALPRVGGVLVELGVGKTKEDGRNQVKVALPRVGGVLVELGVGKTKEDGRNQVMVVLGELIQMVLPRTKSQVAVVEVTTKNVGGWVMMHLIMA
ncbi:Protein RNA-directed DNA methylation 3 [Bienertia sinuspersici]